MACFSCGIYAEVPGTIVAIDVSAVFSLRFELGLDP